MSFGYVSLPAKGKAADIKMPPVKRPLSSFILPFPGAALHTRAGLSWWLQCIQDLLYLTNMFQKLKLWVFFSRTANLIFVLLLKSSELIYVIRNVTRKFARN